MSGRPPHPVHTLGHRPLMGATDDDLWNGLGRLQFDFLLARGLQPGHAVVDIGCGALRAGVHLVPYLEPGGYLGLEKDIELIIYGVVRELGVGQFAARRPEFVVSDRFEFDRLSRAPDYGLAHALFLHLGDDEIRLCLSNLRARAAAGCRLFATFAEADAPQNNPVAPFRHLYTRAEMEAFGRETGWTPAYIGDWGHPRGQVMMEFTLQPPAG